MTTTRLPPGARVEAWPVNVPLEAPYRFALGTYRGMSRTVVRVTTADGVVGLGETGTPYEAALIAGDAERVLREGAREAERQLAGDNPAQRWSQEEGMLLRRAYAGLELALWDVEARERGVPLYELLGGAIARRSRSPSTSRSARDARRRPPKWRPTARAWSRSSTRRGSRGRSA
jgi:glucarate dehydratase